MMAYNIFIPINEDTIYLMEAMKVEGYWKTTSYTLTIQNKDVPLLNHIESIAIKLGVKPAKRIILKIRLGDETSKEDVKIIINNNEINYHIEKSPFDNKKRKAVTNLSYKDNYKMDILAKDKKYHIELNSYRNKFNIKGDIQAWAYEDLRFPVKKLLIFLDKYGGSKKLLRVSNVIKSNEKLILSAFSALIDCEGSINWYGLKRVIRIRMRSKEYLKDWSEILDNMGIGHKYRKNKNDWEINISGWEDFKKLESKGLKLYHSIKREKWKNMMKGFQRNQISRGSYKEYYLNKLKDHGKEVSAIELAKFINKSKRTVNHFLLKLEKDKLIERTNKGEGKPYLYRISTSSVR